MPRKHLDPRWQRVRKQVKPRLLAQLPHPCPRCGRIMEKGMRLDLGHIQRRPEADYDPSNLRLEHMSCNRRDGQRITTAKRLSKTTTERLPKW
jgi:hypothetical protein